MGSTLESPQSGCCPAKSGLLASFYPILFSGPLCWLEKINDTMIEQENNRKSRPVAHGENSDYQLSKTCQRESGLSEYY